MIWKKKIKREIWIQEGDRKSKFFHLSTPFRRRKKYAIWTLQDQNGNWVQSRKQLEDHVVHHFKYYKPTKLL